MGNLITARCYSGSGTAISPNVTPGGNSGAWRFARGVGVPDQVRWTLGRAEKVGMGLLFPDQNSRRVIRQIETFRLGGFLAIVIVGRGPGTGPTKLNHSAGLRGFFTCFVLFFIKRQGTVVRTGQQSEESACATISFNGLFSVKMPFLLVLNMRQIRQVT